MAGRVYGDKVEIDYGSTLGFLKAGGMERNLEQNITMSCSRMTHQRLP